MAADARSLNWLGVVGGTAAAVGMMQIAPRFGEVGRFNFLRGLEALIQAWRLLAERTGETLGQLPLVPPVTGDVITLALFAIGLALPVAISAATSGPPRQLAHIDPVEYYRQMHAQHGVWAPLMKILQSAGLSVAFVVIYAGVVAPELIRPISNEQERFEGPLLIFGAIMIGLVYLFALATLRGYLVGLVVALALVITAQTFYWIDAPWVSDQIRALTDGRSAPTAE